MVIWNLIEGTDITVPQGREIRTKEDLEAFLNETGWSEDDIAAFIAFAKEGGISVPFKISFNGQGDPELENLPTPEKEKEKKPRNWHRGRGAGSMR